jgi:hypothetical protein
LRGTSATKQSRSRLLRFARICGRPPACKRLDGEVIRIACAHMCGIGARWTLPSWYPRRALRAMTRHWLPLRAKECRAFWIDRSHHLPHASSGLRCARLARAPNAAVSFLVRSRAVSPSRPRIDAGAARRRGQGARSAARRPRSGAAGVLDGVEHGATLCASEGAPSFMRPRPSRRWQPHAMGRGGMDHRVRP